MRVKRPSTRGAKHHASWCSFSWLPQFTVAFFGVLMIVMYVVGFHISGQLSHENALRNNEATALGERDNNNVRGTKEQHSGLMSLHGSTSCQEARNKVAIGEWVDPNLGKIYARETVSNPSFRISLHDKEYDEVRWRIMEEGRYYEHEVHERFVEILSKETSSMALDVGANIGYYTLLSLALGHHVVSFEPNPANILRMCDSLRLNDWNFGEKVQVFQKAVGETHGEEMTLHAPRNPGQGFLKPVEAGDEQTDSHKAKTTVVSLDKFAEEQGWFTLKPPITLLKVDVEGKDPYVFLGASRLLKSGMVQNVLTECRRFGRPAVSEMFVVLFDAGFTLKEPKISFASSSSTSEDKAKAVIDWAFQTLGRNSQNNVDMWWIKE